jgi:hypothetical protein
VRRHDVNGSPKTQEDAMHDQQQIGNARPNSARRFRHPMDVVEALSITADEKLTILKAWEADERDRPRFRLPVAHPDTQFEVRGKGLHSVIAGSDEIPRPERRVVDELACPHGSFLTPVTRGQRPRSPRSRTPPAG